MFVYAWCSCVARAAYSSCVGSAVCLHTCFAEVCLGSHTLGLHLDVMKHCNWGGVTLYLCTWRPLHPHCYSKETSLEGKHGRALKRPALPHMHSPHQCLQLFVLSCPSTPTVHCTQKHRNTHKHMDLYFLVRTFKGKIYLSIQTNPVSLTLS